MARAIVIERYGGPEVLKAQEVDVGQPAAGQLRLRQTFVGVNFHDIYVRRGIQHAGAKAQVARAAGCKEVILYREEDVAQRVASFTAGRGVDVAYDGVGADSFAGSLASLAPCGHLVSFGKASGAVPPVPLSQLAARSTTLSRPVIFHYVAARNRLEQMAELRIPLIAGTHSRRSRAVFHADRGQRSAVMAGSRVRPEVTVGWYRRCPPSAWNAGRLSTRRAAPGG